MLGNLRNHLRSNVVGYVAVFIALGGTTYAATQLPKNSVGPKQIEKNAVKAPEIAADAVRPAEVQANAIGTEEVADASLLSEDFAPGQLPPGLPGPQGEQGIPGESGESGEPATKLFAYIRDTASPQDTTASIAFESGVGAVTDPAGSSEYTVTFDRSLANCVVQAVPGFGNPPGVGNATGVFAMPFVGVSAGELDHQAQISFVHPTAGIVDTAFMVAAFC